MFEVSTRTSRLASATIKRRVVRAANSNGDRRLTVRLSPEPTISVAEIEVFGALLAQIEGEAANDNAAETPHEW